MIDKIRNLVNVEYKKRLLSNFFSLSVLQVANYILPLITLPYLIRVLGVEYFGLLSFATATVVYFQILTDYGFNLTATREISIHRNNKEKVIEIFSSVMTIQFILIIVSFLLLFFLVVTFEKFSKDALIYFLTFGTVIGQVLFPVWFFQGMERMKYITYLNIFSKVIFSIAIFVFVNEKSDYSLVPLLMLIGSLLTGILSLYFIKRVFQISFSFQPINTLVFYIKDSWSIFCATAFSSLYRESNIIILGIFTSNTIVGYYAIAEKIIKSIQSIQMPFGQTLFPYLSQKKEEEINIIIFKYLKYSFLCYFIIWFIVFLNSNFIVKLFTGDLNMNIVFNFEVLSFVIIIGGMNYYLGVMGFLTAGKNKQFLNSVMIAGITNIIFCLLLSYFFEDKGATYSLIISEILLFFTLWIKINSGSIK